ncbi:hypothetical protein [Cutibacterium avidum]|uniref:hypothetical protein n=1 Tax=Cutibacterium avidum TaxID=33010 RepID=UPI0003B8F450|nr:hypothetical protein [Cutibacterium avidum]ERS24853.1 hypothetical protein HMPREF1301_00238 [Propionibacterium sp. KPL2005]ERS26752.1 hypothetical protein HMPREF1297_02342 [Propionibacterium sp. KPL2000]MDU1018182.1 hypothetical protein [Clostridium perfringens]MDU2365894.1 hypothetical protein [Klebsiella michiganensis]MCO6658685.1 hypothetical protein [Cutibacterium avidum]
MIQGQVSMVTTVEAGGIAVAWSGHDLHMVDASQLAPDGGQISPDGGTTVIGYSAVSWGIGDTDPDTVTTDVEAPSQWTPQDGEQWFQVWPPAVDIVAAVQLHDGTSVRAIVPHNLRAVLPDGMRDGDSAESVTVELSDGQWTVSDVMGRRAIIPMSALSREVTEAIASADGKSTVTHSINAPDGPGSTVGDTWFRHDDHGHTIGMWHWGGTAWQPDKIDGQALANLDAGTITSGSLSGIDIWSPSATALPRVHVGASTVEVIRSDDDGQEITTVSLGGPDTDRMVLSDRSGSPIAGFEQDGALLATSATVNGTLTIGGDDIMDIIGRLPQGVVARQKLGSTSSLNAITYGSSDLGLLELQIPMVAGRLYRFVASGMAWSGGAGRLVLMARMTTDGSAPTISSPRAGMAAFTTDGSTHVEFALFLPVQASDVTARILLTARQQKSPDGGHLASDDTYPFDIYVEDVGTYPSWGDGAVNTGGGTPLQGGTVTPTAPTVTTRTTTWNAAAVRSWRGGSAVTDSLHHGYYGGYQRYSLALWGSQPSDALSSGGVHIQGVWLYLRNRSWFNYVGGYARIGHFDSTALPGSPQTSGGGAFTTQLWKPGAGMWIPIPSGWWSGIARGTIRGFTLGEGAGTSTDKYGKFSSALSDIKLKVTYTK